MDCLTDASLKKEEAIKKGDTELLLSLLDFFSNQCLSSDKISKDEWALHCLHPVAFQDESRLKFTKQVIKKYVDAGWDVNSVSTSSMTHVKPHLIFNLEKFNLLHLVCLFEGHLDIIKFLVEQTGAHLNCKTTGQLELTPLQILLTAKQWDSASYLIDKGADLKLVGRFKPEASCIVFAERSFTFNCPNFKSDTCLNAVELLVRMGHPGGLWILNQILTKTEIVVSRQSAARILHMAVLGTNLDYVATLLQHCSKMISVEDLSWITLRGYRGRSRTIVKKRVPSLLWLLHTICRAPMSNDVMLKPDLDRMNILAHLIQLFVELGYNLNLDWGWGSPTNPVYAPSMEPLIFYALRIGFFHGSTLPLATVLQVDHLELGRVTSSEGRNPVEYLLDLLTSRNFYYYLIYNEGKGCWDVSKRTPADYCVDAVKLLLSHGLDVAGMVIGGDFKYRSGFKPVLQMMYRSGARIVEQFFSQASCVYLDRKRSVQEIAELTEWKEEFDQRYRMSLKNICRLRVRKMLKRVGDLKMLDQLPVHLKEAVLGNGDL